MNFILFVSFSAVVLFPLVRRYPYPLVMPLAIKNW